MSAPRKYHNRLTEVDGITFHSRAEAARYQELRLLERAGEIADLILQPAYPLVVNGVRVGKYVGDFAYTERDGRRVLEDVKGVKTAVYQLKKRLMAALYGIVITEVMR